jgi:hypothetical protein
MATLRTTGSAVLGTVTTAANAAVKTISTIGLVADYAHDWMEATVEDQRQTLKVQAATSKERAIVSASMKQAEFDMQAVEFCKMSSDHERLFNANLERFRSALS